MYCVVFFYQKMIIRALKRLMNSEKIVSMAS